MRVLRDTAMAGQSAAAGIGIRHALDAGFDRVLLVPGDTPLLDPAELDELLERAGPVAIVPDRHLAGHQRAAALPARRDRAQLRSRQPGSPPRGRGEAGLDYSVERLPTLMLDVDTPEDLAELAAALELRRGQAPSTRGALRQLDRSHARASARPGRATPVRASA